MSEISTLNDLFAIADDDAPVATLRIEHEGTEYTVAIASTDSTKHCLEGAVEEMQNLHLKGRL
jgi:hypothetical protein